MLAELLLATVMGVTKPEPPKLDLKPGTKYGQVIIPRLHEKEVIREGAGPFELDNGVGHMHHTLWPGEGGLTALWGHRVTPVNGRSHGPFRNIDRLEPGDKIILKRGRHRYVYRMTWHRVIRYDAVRVFHARDHELLTIAACHPPGSAEFRYVVFARPV